VRVPSPQPPLANHIRRTEVVSPSAAGPSQDSTSRPTPAYPLVDFPAFLRNSQAHFDPPSLVLHPEVSLGGSRRRPRLCPRFLSRYVVHPGCPRAALPPTPPLVMGDRAFQKCRSEALMPHAPTPCHRPRHGLDGPPLGSVLRGTISASTLAKPKWASQKRTRARHTAIIVIHSGAHRHPLPNGRRRGNVFKPFSRRGR
jgi:hypothetical protein